MTEFYNFRLGWYDTRKQHMMTALNAELTKLDNRTRFILMVVSEELKIRNVPVCSLLMCCLQCVTRLRTDSALRCVVDGE
jgi:DNA topoisomerase-2